MRMHWRVLAAVAAVLAILGLALPMAAQARVSTTTAPTSPLNAVTCDGARNCWAVGGPFSGGAGFIEHWNGSSWRVVPSHNPPQSSSSVLNGVACARINNCWAVGNYDTTAAATLPYAEHWNGRAWSEVALPHPANGTLVVNLLRAVSCPAARLCFAVGGYDGPVGPNSPMPFSIASLIERWNGRSWKVVPAPVFRRADVTGLEGLSCAGAGDCWATGQWANMAGRRGGALGYHWNGRRWTATAITATSQSREGSLGAVSCPALRMCMAIGSRESATGVVAFAERWNGSSWAAAPLSADSGDVIGVSCASRRFCVAVGRTGVMTLVEKWNGSSWNTVASPNPRRTRGAQEFGVACTRTTNCWAVGAAYPRRSGATVALIEHWNGRKWTVAQS